jgi:phenylalanyl-tRNA synthetase beta chain
MRLVVSWLREFVDVKASADEIAATLGLRGFEVAAIERIGDDAVIDFEITANRPDCLNVVGLAREVSTAFNTPLRLPGPAANDANAATRLATLPTGPSDRIKVMIDDEALCPRYATAVADVKIQPSPAWMAARLTAAGVRPISNVVDVTNYVNLELGQPMHAFDLAKLAGAEIRVRRATAGERIRTLDDVERQLDADMLVIADRDRPQAVAGVMGGAESEVSSTTTTVAFESAFFNAVSVRKTSRRLGLKTEASFRFERGADLAAQRVAIERAAALLERLNAGRIVGPVVDCYPHPRAPRTLHLRRERLARLLGVAVPDADVARILTGLGLAVQAGSDGWDVVVPLFRVDVLREVDLIEEVGRHYGFDRLAPTFPPLRVEPEPPDPRIARDQLIRRLLTAAGLSEAITFGFIEAKAEEAFRSAASTTRIGIANPLSAKFDTLRSSLAPGLVDVVAHNRRHGRRDVAVFEIGARFTAAGESRGVGIAWTGGASAAHWSGAARDVDFFDVAGLVERVCAALGVPVRLSPAREPFLVVGQTASVIVGDGPDRDAVVGVVGQLAPQVADGRGLPRQDRVIVAELDLDALRHAAIAAPEAVQSLPRYPFVVRDVSIVVPATLPAEIIRGTIQAAARESHQHAPLVGLSFFDRYQGKGVPDGSVSLSVRLTFQSDERTLTDAEVQTSFDTILAALVREHGAIQR